jgi:hypothetical protein
MVLASGRFRSCNTSPVGSGCDSGSLCGGSGKLCAVSVKYLPTTWPASLMPNGRVVPLLPGRLMLVNVNDAAQLIRDETNKVQARKANAAVGRARNSRRFSAAWSIERGENPPVNLDAVGRCLRRAKKRS